MKKRLTLFALVGILLIASPVLAADVKLTAISEDTAPTSDDLVMTVDDVAGTPASKKATIANFMKAFAGTSGYVWVAGGDATAPTWTEPTGTGAPVKEDTPTLVTPVLGTPTSGTLTNCDGLPLTSGVTGVLPIANGGTGQGAAADAFGALKQDAAEDATGVVELATDAETVTGTATDKVTTPANITARLAAPGAIGGTTPGAGTFTAANVGVNGSTSGVITWIASDNDQITVTITTDDLLAFAGAAGGYTFDGPTTITGPIAVNDANGGSLVNEAASGTNPTLIPDKSDDDTGIGAAAADQLSLVAGGVEAARCTEGDTDTFDFKVGLVVSVESVTCGDGTNTCAYNASVISSYYTTDDNADGADVVTVTDGSTGQRRTFVLKADGGDDLAITPSNFINGTTVTLDTAGESVTLEFDGTNWFIIGQYGATIS